MTDTVRERWGQRTAEHLVDGALSAVERLPVDDRNALLREIARRALWHMPDARAEAKQLMDDVTIDRLKQPDPRDKPPGRD